MQILKIMQSHNVKAEKLNPGISYSILYACNICRTTFASKTNLDEHFEIQHPTYFECGKSFLNIANLKRHVSNVHPKNKNYDCESCNPPTQFVSWPKLIEHLTNKHPVLFQICHESSTSSSNQSAPSKTNKNPNTSSSTICTLCGLSFKGHNSISYHLKNCHSSRHFKCPHCTCSFGTKSALGGRVTRHHNDVIGFRRRSKSLCS